MKKVFIVTSNIGGIYGVFSTKEKADRLSKKIQNDLLSGGHSYSTSRVVEAEVE